MTAGSLLAVPAIVAVAIAPNLVCFVAAWLVVGVGGAGQVVGRLGYATLTRRTSVRARTALILLAMAATTALLGLLTTIPLLITAAILAGMARGVFTLLQATAVTDRWGRRTTAT
jgi:hypothetical protein